MSYSIRTYSNTCAELKVAETRLEFLVSKKEVIYTKYFPLTAKVSDSPSHTNKRSDPMADYVSEITRINPTTGLSLEEEIEEARNEVNNLRYYLNIMLHNIETLTGIECELFCKIIKDGYSPTKAVNKVAEKYKKEPETIWKYYYPKIKKEISKCIVNV